MKLTIHNILATGLMLSALCLGAGAIRHSTPPSATETTIQCKDHDGLKDIGVKETGDHVASHSYAKSLSSAFRSASEKVMPSVVTIRSISTKNQNAMQPGELPPELRDHPFFKRFFENMPEGNSRAPRGPQRSGMGSGVIVDPSGLIVTNNHVVAGADKLLIKLHDGREFEAMEWKADPTTDIAVVKINSTSSLPAATIGDSDELEVGDWVIAVGAPFGLDKTVTAGIISAKSRGIGMMAREEFLQTDAAINPGNSGGPLVNLDGDVIGINTAISSTNGGYQGVGFAVPVNLARWIGDQLMAHGAVQRAYLGVNIQAIDSSLSKQLGLDAIRGIVVTDVRPGSPAAKAGLQSGDVILEFAGDAISKPGDLQGRVERASLDDDHQVIIMRDGKTMTINVRVEALPASLSGEMPTQTPKSSKSDFDGLGLQLSELTPDVAKQLNVGDATGVVITNVSAKSPADNAGLEAGMVIKKVGQSMISSVKDFERAMKDVNLKDGFLLLVQAGEATRFVVVKG